ncbi:hypothetical protein CPHO_08795 [Corynebacterium phocae]|uniref:PDZ domain-containing protein n=1 Tax=Corynebacterium phocae TaxID=161895 RepID=A0A1L7D488_9CORY|nr:trypsin-like peptidase domain-containing protein [Corynebacterium phocae]APT92969.1 hypothetical protein CPHO_08795 [Corynebacterium phocae]KAA8723306.1 PDZ domain-containing protein [Corynebacterium phocae]
MNFMRPQRNRRQSEDAATESTSTPNWAPEHGRGDSRGYGGQGSPSHEPSSQDFSAARNGDVRPGAPYSRWGAAHHSVGRHHADPMNPIAPVYAPAVAGEGMGGSPALAAVHQRKPKRSVGLGTALALMLTGSVVAGSVVGLTFAELNDSGHGSDPAAVNEVLNRPVANDKPVAPEGSIEQVAGRVLPAVVAIQVATDRAMSAGSGSIISPDGFVLTNHHVVVGAEQGGVMRVTLNNGAKYEADVISSDANTDVAVIKIRGAQDLPFLEFGDSNQLVVGQQVVAVGSPLGLNATVTSGIVSAVNRPVRASQQGGESSLIDAVQTDAAVNPGNSGGPLVDMNGNLVGMNSMIASLSPVSGMEAGSIGLGFAIPANFAKRVADQLINEGQVRHPMLGVQVSGRRVVDGAQIEGVEPGSPADAAGLEAGDIVTRLNDRTVDSADGLIAATRSQDFGATVTLEVLNERTRELRTVEVTLTN